MSAANRRKQELSLIFMNGPRGLGRIGFPCPFICPNRRRAPITVSGLRPVALLEFFLAAAWARIVAANVLQRVAHRLLMSVAAVRAVDMAVIVAVVVIMVIVIVVAVRTMDMGLLSH